MGHRLKRSDERREGVRLVTGTHRAFSLNAGRTFVHVPYPPTVRDWSRRTLTCGIALQCAPSKDRLAGYRLSELTGRELHALTLVEAGVLGELDRQPLGCAAVRPRGEGPFGDPVLERVVGEHGDASADREGVEIRYYSVIYNAIEEIEQALKGMLKPEFEEVELGTAEIREIFRSSKFGNIAGSIVRSGEIKRGARARITRDGVVVSENVEVAGLRRFKDDVTEVREGFECGINLGSYNDLQLGDLIATYEMREKPRA